MEGIQTYGKIYINVNELAELIQKEKGHPTRPVVIERIQFETADRKTKGEVPIGCGGQLEIECSF